MNKPSKRLIKRREKASNKTLKPPKLSKAVKEKLREFSQPAEPDTSPPDPSVRARWPGV